LVLGALAIGILPLLVVVLVVPTRVAKAFEDSGRRHLAQAAQDISTTVEQLLTRHREIVQSLATSELLGAAVAARNTDSLKPDDLAVTNRQIAAMLQGAGGHYQGMWLCDARGTIFAGCLKGGDTSAYVSLDIRDRSYLKEVGISEPCGAKTGSER
jgi:hypothetical protein